MKKKKNAHSIHRFEEGAGSSKPLPYVKVPKTYNAFCTSRVLVLEYVAGIKISDVETIDATEGAAGRVCDHFPKRCLFFSSRTSESRCDASREH